MDKKMKKNEGCNCEATCHLDEEREQEQRLSPVSVMDFQSQQDGDDDCNDDGHSEDEGTSPTFEPSLANIQSKFLLSGWLHCDPNSTVDPVTPTLSPCKLNCSVSCAHISSSVMSVIPKRTARELAKKKKKLYFDSRQSINLAHTKLRARTRAIDAHGPLAC
jgi:hypothetical protein